MDNDWCFEEDMLQQHMVSFFKALFTMDYEVRGTLPYHGNFSVLSFDKIGALLFVALDEEIRRAIFSMAPLKAPRVDGFQLNFFQTQWGIVGPSMCSFIRHSLGRMRLDPKVNRALLVLISKTLSPKRITHFILISLCSVLDKILRNTIVNRLQPLMVK